MTPDPLPFRLDEGIWLEDLGVLLPWNTKLEELRGVGSPEIFKDSTCLILSWRNRVFMGQQCDVVTHRVPPEPDDPSAPSTYILTLDTLHWAGMNWLCPAHWSVDEIIQSFKSTYEKLRQSLGDATYCSPGYAYTKYASREGSLPAIHWELGATHVGLSAQFPPHLIDHRKHLGPDPDFLAAEFSVFIRHEPEGYEELKAAARHYEDRRGGAGRPVNGVVW